MHPDSRKRLRWRFACHQLSLKILSVFRHIVAQWRSNHRAPELSGGRLVSLLSLRAGLKLPIRQT
jgi:hypothetical protein